MVKRQFTVKVKDRRQNTTHTLHEFATSQREANIKALDYLIKVFNHEEFEIV